MIVHTWRVIPLVLVFGASACSSSNADDRPAGATLHATGGFTVTPAQRAKLHLQPVVASTFQPVIQTTGLVVFNGDRSTQVLAPVGGPVTRVFVQPGTYVSKGTPLATVSSPDFASAVAAYRKAQVTTQNLRHVADVNQQLFQHDALSRRDLEQSQAEAASAEADRDATVQQMRALGMDERSIDAIQSGRPAGPLEATIRAPISGVVVQRLITPGQLLAAGTTPCFTIADLSTMWVMTSVFAADLGFVTRGQRATVTTDASPTPLVGTVDYVGALVDSGTNATAVRVVVPNPGQRLKQDMYTRVAIQSTQRQPGLLVPSKAVLRDDDNLPFVFVALPDGSFSRRRVTLGALSGDAYQVTAGVAAGDRVVTDGALFLQFAESQ